MLLAGGQGKGADKVSGFGALSHLFFVILPHLSLRTRGEHIPTSANK
jgi:hypothetical protein